MQKVVTKKIDERFVSLIRNLSEVYDEQEPDTLINVFNYEVAPENHVEVQDTLAKFIVRELADIYEPEIRPEDNYALMSAAVWNAMQELDRIRLELELLKRKCLNK